MKLTISKNKTFFIFFYYFKNNISICSFIFSSKYFIVCTKDLTSIFGVAETTIGITIIAFGTSLPEVIATILSILKNKIIWQLEIFSDQI